NALVLRLKEAEKEIGSLRTARALSDSASLIKNAEDIGSFKFISADMGKGFSGEDLRTVALDLRNRLKGAVVALLSSGEEKVTLVVAVDESARSAGVKAGVLVKIASGILGGGGGGKDDFAQGGGNEFGKIEEALKAIRANLMSI
ncbi:MAG: alanine--tRNA ligase, partial [Actinobacteria bacterium]|nr:alanine--tRNA ligase [Actinomycetota bacterium]